MVRRASDSALTCSRSTVRRRSAIAGDAAFERMRNARTGASRVGRAKTSAMNARASRSVRIANTRRSVSMVSASSGAPPGCRGARPRPGSVRRAGRAGAPCRRSPARARSERLREARSARGLAGTASGQLTAPAPATFENERAGESPRRPGRSCSPPDPAARIDQSVPPMPPAGNVKIQKTCLASKRLGARPSADPIGDALASPPVKP